MGLQSLDHRLSEHWKAGLACPATFHCRSLLGNSCSFPEGKLLSQRGEQGGAGSWWLLTTYYVLGRNRIPS